MGKRFLSRGDFTRDGSMDIPTREDINVYGSLDEQAACDHFFGENLKEAEDLFRENSQFYQEDLMWMGPRAFRYYVNAAINYLQSESAGGDSDVLHWWGEYLHFGWNLTRMN